MKALRQSLSIFLLTTLSIGCGFEKEFPVKQNSEQDDMMIEGEIKDFCYSEQRVCTKEYRPHSCFLTIDGTLIEAKGGNQCQARFATIDQVCERGLSGILNDPSEIECKPSQRAKQIFSVDTPFMVSSSTRGSSFEARWDGQIFKVNFNNWSELDGLEDHTSLVKPLIDELNMLDLPASESKNCQQDPAAQVDGAHYISIESGGYECKGQEAFNEIHKQIMKAIGKG